MGPSYTFLPWLVLHAFHASIWRDSRGSRASHWFSSDFRQIDDLVQHLGFDLSAGSAWGINCINCQYLGRQKFELDFTSTSLHCFLSSFPASSLCHSFHFLYRRCGQRPARTAVKPGGPQFGDFVVSPRRLHWPADHGNEQTTSDYKCGREW